MAKKTKQETTPEITLRPIGDRIVVQTEELSEKTAGGLYIPNTVEVKSYRGTVVAVGTGKRDKNGDLHPLDVEKGNQVLFGAHAGTTLDFQGKKVLILKEDEILAVVG